MILAARTSHLRLRSGHDHHRVTFVELFFDLVFVFAVTQLSHGLLHHLSPLGVAEVTVLLVAMWWSWIDTAWTTNWLDPERPAVRMTLFALMLAGLIFAAAIPSAFQQRGIAVAAAYLVMQAMRDLFMLWATFRHDRANFLNFLRIGTWHLAVAPLWIAGCVLGDGWRLPLWAAAVVLESGGPLAGFYVPGLGRSTTADWVVEGAHMAERCGLFIIIALGESVLITGANFAALDWTMQTWTAFLAAFTGSVALWAVYFNIGAERASRQIASSDDPGRLARGAYTYLHVLIVAGIIVTAVGDEIVLHHPDGAVGTSTLLTVIGGPALYLTGTALFKRFSAPNLPLSHLIGLGLFALAVPVSFVITPMWLSVLASLILIVVALWEWRSLRHRPER